MVPSALGETFNSMFPFLLTMSIRVRTTCPVDLYDWPSTYDQDPVESVVSVSQAWSCKLAGRPFS